MFHVFLQSNHFPTALRAAVWEALRLFRAGRNVQIKKKANETCGPLTTPWLLALGKAESFAVWKVASWLKAVDIAAAKQSLPYTGQ